MIGGKRCMCFTWWCAWQYRWLGCEGCQCNVRVQNCNVYEWKFSRVMPQTPLEGYPVPCSACSHCAKCFPALKQKPCCSVWVAVEDLPLTEVYAMACRECMFYQCRSGHITIPQCNRFRQIADLTWDAHPSHHVTYVHTPYIQMADLDNQWE